MYYGKLNYVQQESDYVNLSRFIIKKTAQFNSVLRPLAHVTEMMVNSVVIYKTKTYDEVDIIQSQSCRYLQSIVVLSEY